jgi:hypothetical protein
MHEVGKNDRQGSRDDIEIKLRRLKIKAWGNARAECVWGCIMLRKLHFQRRFTDSGKKKQLLLFLPYYLYFILELPLKNYNDGPLWWFRTGKEITFENCFNSLTGVDIYWYKSINMYIAPCVLLCCRVFQSIIWVSIGIGIGISLEFVTRSQLEHALSTNKGKLHNILYLMHVFY